MCFQEGGTKTGFNQSGASDFEIKNAKFKITGETEGLPTEISEAMVLAPNWSRIEMPDKPEKVIISDLEKGKMLFLCPAKKLAFVTNYTNMPKREHRKIWFLQVTSQLLDAHDILPDFEREPLGEKEIDGRQAVGYRLSGPGKVIDRWGDPQTGQPIRIETTSAMFPKQKMTMSDFVFNVDLDESLFCMEPPADYETEIMHSDLTPAEEKDLVETFRRYSQLEGYVFPETLDWQVAFEVLQMHWAKSTTNEGKMLDEKQMQQRHDELHKLTHGLGFAFRQFDAHYAGKGVALGAASTPIFWYRPKDAKNYRVIYADLSVSEAEMPPSVLNAQAISVKASPEK